jgi:hypothetical protein
MFTAAAHVQRAVEFINRIAMDVAAPLNQTCVA